MIPDFALDPRSIHGPAATIYGTLALGWRGTTKQWHRLETAMQIMAIAIIPVAVSVHTIVSFDFSMAPVPMWHSTIFGPYFVAGAIFSGIAGLILAMAALRKFLHLEEYLQPVHFENLGKLLLMMSLLWGYFVFNERLTAWYGNDAAEMNVFCVTQKGSFAPLFWTMVVCNFVVPFTMLSIRKLRTISGCVIASIGVCVGMWLERFLIVVPSLGHKYLPYSWGHYRPRPVEIIITVATFAAMMLLYTLFAKFVPIISIWEMKAGEHRCGRRNRHRRPSAPVDRGDARMNALYALYPDGDAAQRAVNALRAAGVSDDDITVISAEPMEDFEFGEIDRVTLDVVHRGRRRRSLGWPFAYLADAHDRGGVAAEDRQHADRRMVAEPDRHLRVDDARCDPRDGHHADRHRRPRPADAASLRRRRRQRKGACRGRRPRDAAAVEQALRAGGAVEVHSQT